MTGHDLLSQMLNPDGAKAAPPKRSPPVERVTPGTINRIKNQSVIEEYEAKIETLEEEIAIRKTAAEEVAGELIEVAARAEKAEALAAEHEKKSKELEEEKERLLAAANKEIEALKSEIGEIRANASRPDPALTEELENAQRKTTALTEEIESLKSRLEEAEKTALSSSVLLDKPAGFTVSEKFPGEIRAHLIAALAEAMRSADQGGKERRAKILEAILCANPPTEELALRRDTVRDIMKNTGSAIGESAIAEFEKMGFRFISGNKHNKLDWGGVRIIIPKTPSDHRSFLNSAIDIANKVF